MSTNKIILLVGPKGAGKTYLGSRMERELGIGFLSVEPIWLDLAKDIVPGSDDYDDEGQARVLAAVQSKLSRHGIVALESTGVAPWFPRQLSALSALGELVLVKVDVPLSLCSERFHQRDALEHIPLSGSRLDEINARASKIDLQWTMKIRNESEAQVAEFLNHLQTLVDGADRV